jgi:poly-D-alanine transfer protein DltD
MWMDHFVKLLNVQSDSEHITENSFTTENDCVPDKVEVNMLDLETVMRQMKNNKSPGFDDLIMDMIKAAGPVGTQWLF